MKITLYLAASALALPVSAAPLKIDLPAETTVIKDGPGRDIVMGNCLICHSLDYITSQPPQAAAAWRKTVEKMKTVFGSPLADADVPAVVDYLAKNYGPPPDADAKKPASP